MAQAVLAHRIGQLGGEDAGRHGNDRVTGDHHHGGQRLAQRRQRDDVAESDGGQGDYRPVDAHRNAGEALLGPSMTYINVP